MAVLCTIVRVVIMGLNLIGKLFFSHFFFSHFYLYLVLPVIDEGPGHLYQLVSLLFVTFNISLNII